MAIGEICSGQLFHLRLHGWLNKSGIRLQRNWRHQVRKHHGCFPSVENTLTFVQSLEGMSGLDDSGECKSADPCVNARKSASLWIASSVAESAKPLVANHDCRSSSWRHSVASSWTYPAIGKVNSFIERRLFSLENRKISTESVKDDDKQSAACTGLPSYGVFQALYHYLSPKAERLLRWKGKETMR